MPLGLRIVSILRQMSYLRRPLVWSLAAHGAAIGLACAVGGGRSAAARMSLQIAVLPAEASLAAIASAAPVEVIEIERETAERLLPSPEVPPEDLGAAVTDVAPAPARESAAEHGSAAAWFARVTRPPEPPVMVVPPAEVVAPVSASAAASDAARVVEVVPGCDPKPEYPALARRRGWQGATLVAVEVSADGSVVAVEVATSSGYGVLDRAALRAVRGWRFRGGAGRTTVVVEFQLRP